MKQITFFSLLSCCVFASCLKFNSRQQDHVVQVASPVLEAQTLSNFKFPDKAQIFSSAHFQNKLDFENDVSNLSMWLKGTIENNGDVVKDVATRCAAKITKIDVLLSPTQAPLECLAWQLQELTKQRVAAASVVKPMQKFDPVKTQDQWTALKGNSFKEVFQKIVPTNIEQLLFFYELSKSNIKNCDFKNANAALLLRADYVLPDMRALDIIEDLYLNVSPCLKNDDVNFEKIHQRMGLLRIYKNKNTEAKQSLLMANNATSPQEKQRTLFWLGALSLQKNSDGTYQDNEFWKDLRQSFPLTLHGLLVQFLLQEDPLSIFQQPSDPLVSKPADQTWSELDAALLVFEMLQVNNDYTGMKYWSYNVLKNYSTQDPQKLLYLALCHQKAENNLAMITAANVYMRLKKYKDLNMTLLRMIFPKAFLREINNNVAEGVDPILIMAIIREESGFDPTTQSLPGARGLMQILPITAKSEFGLEKMEELFDPTINIRLGAQYFFKLYSAYGTVDQALAAYNAGPKVLNNWKVRFQNIQNQMLFMDILPYKETRDYVSRILRNAYWYKRILAMDESDEVAQSIVKRSKNTCCDFKSITF